MRAEAGKVADAPQQAKAAGTLDATDRRILDIIQTDFPLAPRPYAVLGERLGLSEEEVFARVRALREKKVIRRLGANFQSAKLGFVSTLCAAKVPDDRLDAFIAAVNAEPGVTHNYLRDHAYNIWFTLISPSAEARAAVLQSLSARTGVPILDLPATRLFKIRVDFRMDGARKIPDAGQSPCLTGAAASAKKSTGRNGTRRSAHRL